MPGITRYNLVDDAQDLRIPMHNEAAFQHGVCFEAKYIGSLEVGRPNSRMEIVAAMRRIRYEFKLKNMKKKKVNIIVSADGVRVVLRKKKKRKEWSWDDNTVMITQDPIYRIFYVSHDAQELKIFSYIARDGQSNMFRCNVFKSKRKSQAMRIVRTVGQAFDVCHQLTLQQTGEQSSEDGLDTNATDADGEDAVPAKTRLALSDSTDLEATTEESIDCLSSDLDKTKSQDLLSKDGKDPALQLTSPTTGPSVSDLLAVNSPRSVEHQVQLLQRLLQQQEQQAQAAAAQTCVLQDQLSVEVRARTDAQARVQRLLLQNTDLLQHISLLVKQIQELELKAAGGLSSSDWLCFFIHSLFSYHSLLFSPPHSSSLFQISLPSHPCFSCHLSPLIPVSLLIVILPVILPVICLLSCLSSCLSSCLLSVSHPACHLACYLSLILPVILPVICLSSCLSSCLFSCLSSCPFQFIIISALNYPLKSPPLSHLSIPSTHLLSSIPTKCLSLFYLYLSLFILFQSHSLSSLSSPQWAPRTVCWRSPSVPSPPCVTPPPSPPPWAPSRFSPRSTMAHGPPP
ncbi:carboxyl-terminal PDZ ligand of neuronal nitric oxide synthase protein-like isoform X1 [Oncorhynchus masou masou]|uniref:carboxyl-terminal PDZ ligand of neuronal nitric oxide synthase protein-like isoform X1 n=1 Tax=Oncorhynchus masou masou TaxID=90313 RepID=UPI003183389C